MRVYGGMCRGGLEPFRVMGSEVMIKGCWVVRDCYSGVVGGGATEWGCDSNRREGRREGW